MPRPKGSKNKKEEVVLTPVEQEFAEKVVTSLAEAIETIKHNTIAPLSVDYPSEGLNDMAKKINEIIERINAL